MLDYMEYIKALLLGIVQGITEWLPISSTAHLLIVDDLVNLQGSEAFKNLFMVVIQLGSILAVVVLFFKELWPFKRDRKEMKASFTLWFKIIVASIPAAILGFFLDDLVSSVLSSMYVIAFTLLLYGVLYMIIEKTGWAEKRVKFTTVEDVSYKDAFCLGLFQSLAIIPGTSRSGSTILGGMVLGFSRELSAKFSFFMAIPVMAGASLLRFVKNFSYVTGPEWGILAFATAISFVVSLFAIKWLVGFVRSHSFFGFGVYRVVLAFVLVLWTVLL